MATAPFQWDDPFFLEDQLSEEERMVRDTVRDYAQEKLMPKVIQVNRDEEFDYDAFHGFAELGIYGTLVPEEYGGSDLNNVCYGLTSRELERVDSAYRSIAGLQVSLVIHPIMTFGSDEQKKKYVPKLVSGDLIGCFGLTEPDHGSDPGGMKSKAVKQDGGFVLNGNKMWISNSPVADVMIVWAKLDDVIRGFILEKDMKGLSTPKINGKLSLRASVTGEIVMEDVFVPEENLLPGAKGLGGPFSCLNKARTGISWGALGAAEFCWHAARNYTVERKQFNRPLAANQLIQKKLADMQTEIAIGLQAVLRVSRLLDEGRCPPEAISIVKRNSAGKALEIARVARDMHGAVGIMEEFHVMRHLMNLETVNTYEGTHDIHALILGRAITGIQAFFPE